MYIGRKAKRQRVHWDGGANAPDWLRAWIQHNFRRTQLLPSREESINSQGTAVQHNFRRTLLVPSREENISSLGAAIQHNLSPKYIHRVPIEVPEDANCNGTRRGSIAHAWLRAWEYNIFVLVCFMRGNYTYSAQSHCASISRK